MAYARFTFARQPAARFWLRPGQERGHDRGQDRGQNRGREVDMERRARPAAEQLAGGVGLAMPPAMAPQEAELPAIVRRAQEHARCAHALQCLGYRKVRAEYARHRHAGRDSFGGLAYADLWPTMDFVRGWLADERRRMLTSIRSTFLAAMLITIIAGLAFVCVLAFLSWQS